MGKEGGIDTQSNKQTHIVPSVKSRAEQGRADNKQTNFVTVHTKQKGKVVDTLHALYYNKYKGGGSQRAESRERRAESSVETNFFQFNYGAPYLIEYE